MKNRKLPFTCKDCPDRYPGCHADCNKYKRETAIWDKQRAAEALEKNITCYVRDNIAQRTNANAKWKKDNRGHKYFGG